MSQMRTETGLMQQTSKDVDGVADQLTSQLNRLMNELTPLYDQWKGAGAGSFQQVRQRFDEDMARLNVALRAIAEAVGSAGRDYDVSDDEIRDAIVLLARTEGIFTETAGGTTLAVLKKLVETGQLDPELEPVVINTGHGLKTLDAVTDLVGPAVTIAPTYDAFVAAGNLREAP